MIAAILAAGRGKRMRPLTETRLKGSLPFHNKPLLLWLVEQLLSSGVVSRVVLVIAPWQEADMRSLFASTAFSAEVLFTVQDPPKGTADAVAQVEPFVASDQRQLLVLNGDILADLPAVLPRLFVQQTALHAKAVLAVFPGTGSRYGLLQLAADGTVLSIKEKQQLAAIATESGYINAGIYLFDRAIFDAIRQTPLSERGEYELTDAITLLGKEGPIGATIIDAWMSLENPLDLLKAQSYFKATVEDELRCMQFHSGGEIGFKAADELFFDAETTIEFSSITIRGPVLLGKGTLVEPGAILGPAVFLGKDCTLGAGVKLAHCLLLDGCRLEAGCTVRNLVAGEEVLIGAQTKIGPPIPPTADAARAPLDPPSQLEELVLIGAKSVIGSKMTLPQGTKLSAYAVHTRDLKEEPLD